MKREFHYTNKFLKNRRRQLRNSPTPTEEILWNELRKSKLGVKFTRQYSVDGYIVDFYCQEKRLAVEVIGEIHNNPSQIVYDKYRYRYINAHDIEIIIVTNHEVQNDIESVKQKILKRLPS